MSPPRIAVMFGLISVCLLAKTPTDVTLVAVFNATLGMSIASPTVFKGAGNVFGLALAVVAGLFVSFRAVFAGFNLELLPQRYLIQESDLAAIQLTAQVSVLASFSTYVALRAAYRFPNGGTSARQQNLRNDIPFTTLAGLAIVLITTRVGLQTFGAGVKGAATSIPLAANMFTLVDILTPLTVTALLVAAHRSHDRTQMRFAVALLSVDALAISLGGTRGGVFDAALLATFGFFVSGGRLNRRALLRFTIGTCAVLVGLNFAIGRRLEVQGGTRFGLVEFLLFRIPGFHRLAPVIHHDQPIGWAQAVQPTAVKRVVYGLAETNPTGVGTSWPGLGFLAQGTFGLILISSLFGAVAYVADRRLSQSGSTSSLVLGAYLAGFLAWSYGGARPRVEIRELALLLFVSVAWRTRRGASLRVSRPDGPGPQTQLDAGRSA